MNALTWIFAACSWRVTLRRRAQVAGHVEAALGRDLLPVLGHEADLVRLEEQRLGDHRRRGRHFQVERNAQRAAQLAHVGVLDVPAILAQVDGDLRRAGALGQPRGLRRRSARAAGPLSSRGSGLRAGWRRDRC